MWQEEGKESFEEIDPGAVVEEREAGGRGDLRKRHRKEVEVADAKTEDSPV